MKRVVCKTTSVKAFSTVSEAQDILNWIRDNLNKGADPDPVDPEIIQVDGGFRYVTYSNLDVEIPVEHFEARKASKSLPMVFDNQELVVVDI
jgi:site-specific recombinase XerD